jgi:hypothetical protein
MLFSSVDGLCFLGKIVPMITLFIGITLACGCARLRMPIEPFLIIMGSAFWSCLIEKRKLFT